MYFYVEDTGGGRLNLHAEAQDEDYVAELAEDWEDTIYFEADLIPPTLDFINTIIRTSILGREDIARILSGLEQFRKKD